jgi:hypothetical protein
MTLLHDIDRNGINPRGRIYIKNSKYPDGHIIEVKYQGLQCILDLTRVVGVTTPDDLETDFEISRLSFAKLVGISREVDIERTVLDTYHFLQDTIGKYPTKDDIMYQLFGGQ